MDNQNCDKTKLIIIGLMFYSLPAETNAYGNIVAAFWGIHLLPAKHSYARLPRKCDYRTDRHTDGRTVRCRTNWIQCAAMLRKWYNKWTTELDLLLNYENFPLNICSGYGMPTLHKGCLLLRSPDPVTFRTCMQSTCRKWNQSFFPKLDFTRLWA